MKIYKEIVKTEKAVDKVFCNICGKTIVNVQSSCDRHFEFSCTLKVVDINHGNFPGQSATWTDYDFCYSCFEKELKPICEKLPPNKTHRDEDSKTTTVTP